MKTIRISKRSVPKESTFYLVGEEEEIMDPKKASAAFPALFNTIREVVYRYDPSGLFSIGAPKDEHDDSVHKIISLLRSTHTLEEVPDVLDQAMGGWLEDNPYASGEMWESMAPEIWEAWKTFLEKAG